MDDDSGCLGCLGLFATYGLSWGIFELLQRAGIVSFGWESTTEDEAMIFVVVTMVVWGVGYSIIKGLSR